MLTEWFYKKLNLYFTWFALAVLCALTVFAANIEIKDLDLWLHLASGKHILQYSVVSSTDIFSATMAGKPWHNHEWLFQVLVYIFYYNWEFDGLTTLQVLIVGVTFIHLLLMGFHQKRTLLPLVLGLCVLMIYQIRFTLRPDLFSLLFLVLYIFHITRHLDQKRAIATIFVLQVLWTNMHGFFVLGPAILFILVTGEFIKEKIQLPFDWNNTARLGRNEYTNLRWMLFFSVIACFINPQFYKGVFYPLGILGSLAGDSSIFFEHISELRRPLTLNNLFDLKDLFFYKVLLVVSFVSFCFNYKKIDIGALLIWIFFLVFSLMAIRNIVYFVFIAYIVVMVNEQQMSVDDSSPIVFKGEKFRNIASVIIKVLLIVWMGNFIFNQSLRGYFDYDKMERKSEFGGVSLRNFPHKAVDFLKSNNIKGQFFNDFNSGAYLIGRLYPDVKVYIDGRTEVYGAKYFEEYQKAWKGDIKTFNQVVNRFHLTGAFLNSVYVPVPKKLIKYLYESPDWVLVYFDYDASVYLRNIPANQRWIEKNKIDLKKWKTKAWDVHALTSKKLIPYRYINRAQAFYNMGLYKQSKQEIEQALLVAPNNAQVNKIMGKLVMLEGEDDLAFDYARKAVLLDASDNEARYFLAKSLMNLGYIGEAQKQIKKVLGKNVDNHKALLLAGLIYAKSGQLRKSISVLSSIKFDSLDEIGDDERALINEYEHVSKSFEDADLSDEYSEVMRKFDEQ